MTNAWRAGATPVSIPSERAGATWADFGTGRPSWTTHTEQRLGPGICYLATVRPDGFPRVHPMGVQFRGDGAYLSLLPSLPKGHDLRRTGHFALHCTVEDSTGGDGTVILRGLDQTAPRSSRNTQRGWISLELLVEEFTSTRYDPDRQAPVTRRWQWRP